MTNNKQAKFLASPNQNKSLFFQIRMVWIANKQRLFIIKNSFRLFKRNFVLLKICFSLSRIPFNSHK